MWSFDTEIQCIDQSVTAQQHQVVETGLVVKFEYSAKLLLGEKLTEKHMRGSSPGGMELGFSTVSCTNVPC